MTQNALRFVSFQSSRLPEWSLRRVQSIRDSFTRVSFWRIRPSSSDTFRLNVKRKSDDSCAVVVFCLNRTMGRHSRWLISTNLPQIFVSRCDDGVIGAGYQRRSEVNILCVVTEYAI